MESTGTRPRLLAVVSFRSAVAQAGACVVRARRRGLTIVSRDRRGGARVGHEERVPAVDSPPVAAVAGDALPLRCSGFSAVPSRVVVDLRSPPAPLSTACGGDRSATRRRTFSSYRPASLSRDAATSLPSCQQGSVVGRRPGDVNNSFPSRRAIARSPLLVQSTL